jgi:hypothetical protein
VPRLQPVVGRRQFGGSPADHLEQQQTLLFKFQTLSPSFTDTGGSGNQQWYGGCGLQHLLTSEPSPHLHLLTVQHSHTPPAGRLHCGSYYRGRLPISAPHRTSDSVRTADWCRLDLLPPPPSAGTCVGGTQWEQRGQGSYSSDCHCRPHPLVGERRPALDSSLLP